MHKEPEAMRQIHEIQEKIYEKTKNMTKEEFLKYVHKSAEEAKKKYGIKLRKPSHV